MTQVKHLFYGSVASLLTVPAIVAAQYKKPDGTGLPEGANGGSILGIIKNIMMWLLTLVGILGVIAFVIAGILYLTSAGDDAQIKKAKGTMIAAIMGVIVALLGLIVLQAAFNMLSGQTEF